MNTQSLADERHRRLAERYGWSIARAQGYNEGETARTKREKPSAYALVGTDEYCRGYRDGYFNHEHPSVRLPANSKK